MCETSICHFNRSLLRVIRGHVFTTCAFARAHFHGKRRRCTRGNRNKLRNGQLRSTDLAGMSGAGYQFCTLMPRARGINCPFGIRRNPAPVLWPRHFSGFLSTKIHNSVYNTVYVSLSLSEKAYVEKEQNFNLYNTRLRAKSKAKTPREINLYKLLTSSTKYSWIS